MGLEQACNRALNGVRLFGKCFKVLIRQLGCCMLLSRRPCSRVSVQLYSQNRSCFLSVFSVLEILWVSVILFILFLNSSPLLPISFSTPSSSPQVFWAPSSVTVFLLHSITTSLFGHTIFLSLITQRTPNNRHSLSDIYIHDPDSRLSLFFLYPIPMKRAFRCGTNRAKLRTERLGQVPPLGGQGPLLRPSFPLSFQSCFVPGGHRLG